MLYLTENLNFCSSPTLGMEPICEPSCVTLSKYIQELECIKLTILLSQVQPDYYLTRST